jgi:hypothetical protein
MSEGSRQKETAEKVEALRRRLRQIEVDYQTPGSNYYISVERLMKWQREAVQIIQTHLQAHEIRKFQMAWEKVLTDHEIDFTPLRDYLTGLLETMRTEPYIVLVEDDTSAQIAQTPSEGVPQHTPPNTRRVLLNPWP